MTNGSLSQHHLPRGSLKGRIAKVASLSPDLKWQMWLLFSRYYTDVSPARFLEDLQHKQYVICLHDKKSGSLQGFSTIMVIKDKKVAGRTMTVVFSGDTIINKEYWGQTALQRLFASFLLFHKLRRPHRPVVWFLISKGYKTYLLLSRNFVHFWPRPDTPTPTWVQTAIRSLAREMYGDAYRPESNLLIFDHPMGRLKENVAALDERLLQYDDIRFFHGANPRAAQGEELCSLGIFDLSCMGRFGLRTLCKLIGVYYKHSYASSVKSVAMTRPRHAD